MKILIHGAGGIGGYFGAKLAHAGNEVWCVARGEHFAAMKKNGLHVNSTEGEFHIHADYIINAPAEAPVVDLVLFCVKTYDTESAAAQLEPVVDDKTVIISLQNGIDNEEKIQRVLKMEHGAAGDKGNVYGGVANISSRIVAPGEIAETGGVVRIAFGPMNSAIYSERAQEILACFTHANILAHLSKDILIDLWLKFIFITSAGGFMAMSRLTQGEVLAVEQTRTTVFNAMKEVEALALAQNIPIEPLEKEKVFEGMKKFDPQTRPSLYYDIVREKPTELEALNGTVVRLGKQLGIPTPIHNTIYAALLPFHLNNTGKSARTVDKT
jgi:2-dehydropantoate 2-reductase